VIRCSARPSHRKPALWPLLILVAFATLLVRGGTPPATAQTGHTHNWQPGGKPSGQLYVQPSTATPCQVVLLSLMEQHDQDQCMNAGCPYNFGGQGQINDGGALEKRRFTDHGADGTFGYLDGAGKFIPSEMWNPDDPNDPEPYGTPAATHYKAGYKTGLTVTIELEFSNQKSNFAKDPNTWGALATLSVQGNPPPGCAPVVYNARNVPGKKLCGCCGPDAPQPVQSDVTPISGNLHFEIGLGSLGYRATSLDFSLHYNSLSIVDPGLGTRQVAHPAGIGDADRDHHPNPKFTHSYAQWIEVNTAGQAIWNRGDGTAPTSTTWARPRRPPGTPRSRTCC
jgi:hypothetical protein